MNDNKHILAKASGDEASAGAPSPEEKGSGTSEQRRRELADFLRTRREKLKPEQVGIQQGSRRRTPGLRREEVAELAGVGTTWYTWLEQARDIQPSTEVLRRLGQALLLNPAEVRHMFALAGKAAPVDADISNETITPSLERTLNVAISQPAVLLGSRFDVLAMNASADKLFFSIKDLPKEKYNWLYYIFCSPEMRTRLGSGWELNARRVLAEFRAALSESLDNPWVLEIVEMMKAESPEFNQWWREHDVRDNHVVKIEAYEPSKDQGPQVQFERTVLRPWEQPRYRILVFMPLA